MGDLITTRTFLDRVGSPGERKNDRKLCAGMMIWGYRQQMREAREKGDYEAMDTIERNYRMVECL